MTRNILIHHNTFADLSVNDEITENGIYVYLCLKPLVNPNWTYLHTTVTELNSVLSDTDISKRPKQQNIIKQGLKELETANYIKVLSSKKNNFEFELDLDGMVEEYSKDNHYTVFEIEQLKQVLKDNKGYKSILKILMNKFEDKIDYYNEKFKDDLTYTYISKKLILPWIRTGQIYGRRE